MDTREAAETVRQAAVRKELPAAGTMKPVQIVAAALGSWPVNWKRVTNLLVVEQTWQLSAAFK